MAAQEAAKFILSCPSWKFSFMIAISLLSTAHLINCAATSPARQQRQIAVADKRATGYGSINPISNDYLPPEQQQQQNVFNQQIDDYPLQQNDRYPAINNVYNTLGTKQAGPAKGYGNAAWPGFGGGKARLRDTLASGVKY